MNTLSMIRVGNFITADLNANGRFGFGIRIFKEDKKSYIETKIGNDGKLTDIACDGVSALIYDRLPKKSNIRVCFKVVGYRKINDVNYVFLRVHKYEELKSVNTTPIEEYETILTETGKLNFAAKRVFSEENKPYTAVRINPDTKEVVDLFCDGELCLIADKIIPIPNNQLTFKAVGYKTIDNEKYKVLRISKSSISCVSTTETKNEEGEEYESKSATG